MRWRPDTEYMVGLANYQGMSVGKMNFFLDWWQSVRLHDGVRIVGLPRLRGRRIENRDGSCCWTYTLEPVPPPTPPPSPPLPTAVVEGTPQQQNGPVPIAVVAVGGENTPPPTPPPPVPTTTHVKKPMEMRILPHDETEYETRIDQVKRRVAETVHMRRILAEMDANLLQNVTTDNNNDRQFGQQQILLGQTFDWAQFKAILAPPRRCPRAPNNRRCSTPVCCSTPGCTRWNDACIQRLCSPCCCSTPANGNGRQCATNAATISQGDHCHPTNENKTPTETTTAPQQQSQDGAATTAATAQPSVINTDSRMMFTIKDIVHQSFSDFGFLVPGRVARYIGVQGDLDPLLTGTAVLEMALQFLESQFLHQQQQKEEDENDTDDQEEEEEDESDEEEKEEDGEKESTREEEEGKGMCGMKRGSRTKWRKAMSPRWTVCADWWRGNTQLLWWKGRTFRSKKAVSADEERKVANDSGVDTPPTTETTTEETTENNQPSS
ncbi:hypothetical protein niasHS_011914 [Heterodera schachtii]|uniref:1-alkyl-2-acetylglycerophosphocholine esterase n=1 Tax=Heterodera schachtii TaxID=97005 RepID=A0ABD2IWC8_HETSC